jgi:hypothetical protein
VNPVMITPIRFVYDDGGRAAAGFSKIPKGLGGGGDCVCRAVAIATEKPYREVYDVFRVVAGKQTDGHRLDGDGV